jgi:DNA-binding MarR family transcriptional regulator
MTGGLAPLQRVLLIAQRLQQINARWEMQGAALFLLIAIRGQITKPQIERQLKMSKGSSHRNIEMMQDACLVRVIKVRRTNVVRLTEYGVEFAASIAALMKPGP